MGHLQSRVHLGEFLYRGDGWRPCSVEIDGLAVIGNVGIAGIPFRSPFPDRPLIPIRHAVFLDVAEHLFAEIDHIVELLAIFFLQLVDFLRFEDELADSFVVLAVEERLHLLHVIPKRPYLVIVSPKIWDERMDLSEVELEAVCAS